MILASRSPRRVELMREAGYDFRAVPADVDETAREGEGACDLVRRLSAAKAARVARQPGSAGELVVAADTVVFLEGPLGDTVLGKPADADDARRMLRLLSGRTHHVATGVTVMRADADGRERATSFVSVTAVEFFPLSDDEIDRYVATGSPADKAGAYGIQDPQGRMLVRGIEGDYCNVVGLPIARLARTIGAARDAWGD